MVMFDLDVPLTAQAAKQRCEKHCADKSEPGARHVPPSATCRAFGPVCASDRTRLDIKTGLANVSLLLYPVAHAKILSAFHKPSSY